ncbi:putative enzyme related to lactoylglutathione lyase [Caulobacter ginsengisoli]|uniref:Enzyme related to lactoylglutathione lyase n=1 Tax=Caulobacter ginsengisoli TaxID=400775 RepID=A0ABU0IY58_9CAUL|nr:VOC family protein [Caulobacter ginsengisoli]MDQ0466944.1 putative enzyme related to lactoylglutathione lyase [Caulobacter ginsengisoli]
MREDGKVDYVELPGGELPATKDFYAAAFGWRFIDYGPSYAAFDEGLEGGFQADDAEGRGQAVVVLYAHDLETMAEKVTAAGGTIVRPIFTFPGGRRFHFTDPAGNELAVWSQS